MYYFVPNCFHWKIPQYSELEEVFCSIQELIRFSVGRATEFHYQNVMTVLFKRQTCKGRGNAHFSLEYT